MKVIFLAFAMFLLVAMASAGYKRQCTSYCNGYCSPSCHPTQTSQPNCACASYGGVCCVGPYPVRPAHPLPVFAPAPAAVPFAPGPYPHARWPYWRAPHKG